MSARLRVGVVVLQTTKAEATRDLADFVAERLQILGSHFVLVIMLMFTASGKMNADVAAVECLFQKISQAPIVVMRRPVHLAPVAVDLARKSVGECEISTGPAASVPITTLFCKGWYLEAKRICGGFTVLF